MSRYLPSPSITIPVAVAIALSTAMAEGASAQVPLDSDGFWFWPTVGVNWTAASEADALGFSAGWRMGGRPLPHLLVGGEFLFTSREFFEIGGSSGSSANFAAIAVLTPGSGRVYGKLSAGLTWHALDGNRFGPHVSIGGGVPILPGIAVDAQWLVQGRHAIERPVQHSVIIGVAWRIR